MDAIFFLCPPEEALGVSSSEDLVPEPVGEPLRLLAPAALFGLLETLGVEHPLRPLRDATCRSFPVWALGEEAMGRLAAIATDEVDEVAGRWFGKCGEHLDADLYDLACCLGALGEAVRAGAPGDALFVLLEERAF